MLELCWLNGRRNGAKAQKQNKIFRSLCFHSSLYLTSFSTRSRLVRLSIASAYMKTRLNRSYGVLCTVVAGTYVQNEEREENEPPTPLLA